MQTTFQDDWTQRPRRAACRRRRGLSGCRSKVGPAAPEQSEPHGSTGAPQSPMKAAQFRRGAIGRRKCEQWTRSSWESGYSGREFNDCITFGPVIGRIDSCLSLWRVVGMLSSSYNEIASISHSRHGGAMARRAGVG